MSLNQVVSADRLHIGFFGMRNAGKSSLVNAVTGQVLSLVSDVKGTTTDPVKKAMELLPLGPVVILDTPGVDDEGELGRMRVERALAALDLVHIAVLVIDGCEGMRAQDHALLERIRLKKLPYVIAFNKADAACADMPPDAVRVSAHTGEGVDALRARIAALGEGARSERRIISDLLVPGDTVLLVTPIDEAAPKGRLILPQQQTIRDILDHRGIVVTCQDTQTRQALAMMHTPPRIVITDSQAFGRVAGDVPEAIPLTSFSILMARYKGSLAMQVRGAAALSRLRNGDTVLIAEGCTHRRQCGDIGSVKIPAWIRSFTGKEIACRFTSGGEFPQDLSGVALVLHCGGCMLPPTAVQSRMAAAKAAGVPVVNYGVAIAHMHGVLRRSLGLFPDMLALLDEA